jgi:ribosomal protein L12E/L44/L45/RPP1/RPP2
VLELEKTLKAVKRMNHFILYLAMGINYLHQSLFFWSIGAWVLAWVLPLAIDMMILLCVKITQTPGAARSSKRRAMVVLIPFVLLSAAISAVSPGHLFLRIIFAAVVVEIGLAEWLLAGFKGDEVKKEISAKAPRTRSPESVAKAAATRAANKAKKEAEAQKRRETNERRQARKIEKELEVMAAGEPYPLAPISPIPYP